VDSIAVHVYRYLNLSETFIYERLIHFKKFRPIVLAHAVGNLDAFPFRPVHALAGGRIGRAVQSHLMIGAGFAPHFEYVLRRHNVRLIQTHFAGQALNIFRLARRLRLPQVNFFHGSDLDPYLVDAAAARPLAALIASTERTIANCRFMKESLVRVGCNPGKIEVNYAGIDLRRFAFREPRPAAGGRPIRVLMCGRLIGKKGHRYGLDAFARVAAGRPALRLDLIGDGELRGELEAQTAALGLAPCVRFEGAAAAATIAARMAEADVLLFPSLAEGAPNVVKEAMASGLIVLASAVCGIPEIIADGRDGFLVPPADPAALAAKLDFVLEHRESWPDVAAAARRTMETRFDVIKQMEELETIYEDILETRRRMGNGKNPSRAVV
jgi:colanic acid/amylovoran biosynthesis glycosyltransferase